MALLDLGGVTRTLINVVDRAIRSSPAWPLPQEPSVSGLAPDRLTGDSAVGIYLYHVAEEPSLRNQAWPERPHAPVRHAPLALNLSYIVSARSDLEGALAPLREQLLLGLAMKGLHDYPMVDGATEVAGQPVLDDALAGDDNRLRITARQLTTSDAVTYWTAGSQPLRLCAFYEVSVILLEPEEPRSSSGRVLEHVVQAVAGQAPRLSGSRSRIEFVPPGAVAPRAIIARPAQVTLGQELTLIGTDLTGEATLLQLRHPSWPQPLPADPGWGVVAAANEVSATLRPTIADRVLLPGPHTASVTVLRRFAAAGAPRELRQTSNETPFLITPRIDGVTGPDPAGLFTVSGWIFASAELGADAVRIVTGAHELAPGTAGALERGQFAVLGPDSIQARLPDGVGAGAPVPIRVLVRGSESTPRWMELP